MSVAIITGSAGLIGSEAAMFFAGKGMHVVGVDNNMRRTFFGADASTDWNRDKLKQSLGANYTHCDIDIRDEQAIDELFKAHCDDIELVLHTAAQPSHDWAASDPKTDFSVNATGTLNLLEATRRYSSDAVFIFTSTNKVYGDTPNQLPLVELDRRWEIDSSHQFCNGISEDMSIDQSMHSLFGVSKVAADLMVQEYGRYFNLKTGCFRGGCLTGPGHSGTELHGFLSYLMKCTMTGSPYTVFGYKGKQVRDNIHSNDLIHAFDAFFENPRYGAVYNIGGGTKSNCSMLEAIEICQDISGMELNHSYSEANRAGDHIWWVSDISRFQKDYPGWEQQYDIQSILKEIYDHNKKKWIK